MENFIQFTIDGILKGLFYGIVALSINVIYRGGRIINLAQGELLTIQGFLIWTFYAFFGSLSLSIIIALFIYVLLVVLIERIVFRPMIGQSLYSLLIVTLGLMIFMKGLTEMVWGGREYPFPSIFPESGLKIGFIIMKSASVWGAIISLILAVLVWRFYNKTRYGLRLSAVAEDHQVAQSMGISIKQSIRLTWIITSFLSLIGIIIFLDQSSVSFKVSAIGIRVFPVVLLAGIESILGPLLAGIIVGVGEAWSAAYLNPITEGAMSEVFPYIIMLLVLLIRPQGLFGWKVIERV